MKLWLNQSAGQAIWQAQFCSLLVGYLGFTVRVQIGSWRAICAVSYPLRIDDGFDKLTAAARRLSRLRITYGLIWSAVALRVRDPNGVHRSMRDLGCTRIVHDFIGIVRATTQSPIW